ncbi:MAG: hypothetical protein HY815_29165 [Candidatus Riflebacteria bacterium]|nr:hypothetical protein [Candidatus Riflebacteria bacterium]
MDAQVTALLVILGCLVVSAVLSQKMPSGSGPIIFMFAFNTFAGYLNNLFNRHPVIHVARFVLLGFVCVWWLASRSGRERPRPTPLDRPIIVFFGFYAAQMFNPYWSSLRVGVLNGFVGMAVHGVPMLLFFISRDLIRTSRQITLLYTLLIILSTLMAGYGLFQWNMGHEYVAGLGAAFQDTIRREAVWTEDYTPVLKPMSFAGDAGAASSFYAVGILLAASMLVGRGRRTWVRLLLVAAFVVQFMALVVTLVRSTMAATLMGIALLLFLEGRTLRAALPVAGLAAVLMFVGDSGDSFIKQRYMTLMESGTIQKDRGMQVGAIWWAVENFPAGRGIGRAGPVGNTFSEPEDMAYSFPPESYFVCITFEAGVIGLILVARIFWLLLRYAMRAARVVRDPELGPLARATCITLLPIMVASFVGPTLYAAPFSYLFWFFAAVVFRILEVDAARRAHRHRSHHGPGSTVIPVGPGVASVSALPEPRRLEDRS